MKMKRRITRYMALLAVAMISTLTACSYAMDYVERTITKRASFSIDAEYVKFSGITITWNESPGSNFAGYEIYVTREPDNEYADYRIVAARDDITLSSASYYDDFASNLDLSGTRSYLYPYARILNLLSNNGVTSGRYFFRLGIIAWDEDVDERTSENGYDEPWNGIGNIYNNYIDHTDISEISGYAMVDIY